MKQVNGYMKTPCLILVFCLMTSTKVWSEPSDGKRYLIIHADDAGMSHSVNIATIDAMKKGVVSSASIMVPCPWFSEFAEIARKNPERDYGIHLTLNAEWDHYRWGPVAPRERVPSLVDENGYLWDNVAQVMQHAKADEVAIELRAQVDRAKEFGVPLSHLDTHMGAVISRPDLVDIYVKLGVEYDLPVLFLRKLGERTIREYPALAERGPDLLKLLQHEGLPVVDGILQFYDGETHEARRAKYIEALQDLQPGVTQLIIHCGYDNAELRAITNSASRRDGDRRVFMESEILQLIDNLDIEVISWKQLREMTSKEQPTARHRRVAD